MLDHENGNKVIVSLPIQGVRYMKNLIMFSLLSLLGWHSRASWYRAKYLLQIAAIKGVAQPQAIAPDYGRLPEGTYIVMTEDEPWYLAKVYRDQTTVLAKRFADNMVTVSSFPLWKRDRARDANLIACPNDSYAMQLVLYSDVNVATVISYMDNTAYGITRDGHYFSEVIFA